MKLFGVIEPVFGANCVIAAYKRCLNKLITSRFIVAGESLYPKLLLRKRIVKVFYHVRDHGLARTDGVHLRRER